MVYIHTLVCDDHMKIRVNIRKVGSLSGAELCYKAALLKSVLVRNLTLPYVARGSRARLLAGVD